MSNLGEQAMEILNELHTERLNYESEYVPLADAANLLTAYENTGLAPEDILSCNDAIRTDRDIYLDAINVWGSQNRVLKLLEEEAELTEAICHYMEGRDTVEHIAEEIADVRIMLNQIEFMFQAEALSEKIREEKMARLNKILLEVTKNY